jgi:hypothetical protein
LAATEQLKNETINLYCVRGPEKGVVSNLDAPFMLNGGVFDAYTGVALALDYTGVVRSDVDGQPRFMYLGRDGEERTFKGLLSTNYNDALAEAEEKYSGVVLDENDFGNVTILISRTFTETTPESV